MTAAASGGTTELSADELETVRRILAGDSPGILPAGAKTARPGTGIRDDRAPDAPDPVRAAVLVPLVGRPEGTTVLLTRRTDSLSTHAGQVSFPGGRMDAGDRDEEFTALRETQEEIGLDPTHIELLGRLDTYVTRTGFSVTPVVGHVRPPFELRPNPEEVDAVFEVPLAFLLDPANRALEKRLFEGVERLFYAYRWQHYYIWGATAGMLVNLVDLMGRWVANGQPQR